MVKMCSCRGKKRHRIASKKNNANKRAKTSTDYSSTLSQLNRLNLDRYSSGSSDRYGVDRTSSDRYSSSSSILGSSSSSLTRRSSRLPPLESSSNALLERGSLFPSSGSELRSSRSVRSSISSKNTYESKYSSNYESMLLSHTKCCHSILLL